MKRFTWVGPLEAFHKPTDCAGRGVDPINSWSSSMYEALFYGSLWSTLLIASAQLLLGVYPRLSVIGIGNAAMLFTVVAPLLINSLTLGTQVGTWLWFGNVVCFSIMLVSLAIKATAGQDARRLLFSGLGLVSFGIHVFIFAACP
jgi:hypothetical protein